MNGNPYEPPAAQTSRLSSWTGDRASARRNVRASLLIMLAPAFYNFFCLHLRHEVESVELPFDMLIRILNALEFIAIVVSIWFFGLVLLEFVTAGLHSLLSRKAELNDWRKTLYRTLRRGPVFAFFGAALWLTWVFAFYQLDVGFYAVSVPIGIAAHMLAAGLYVPLIYRWYKLERSAAK